MNIADELKSLEPSHVVSIVFSFSAIIAPGYLIIYLFKPQLIASLDVFKLLVFSMSLTLPMLALNYYVQQIVLAEIDPGPKNRLSLALMLAMVVIYPQVLMAYIQHLSFRAFLYRVISAEIFAIIVVAVYWRLALKSFRKSKAK